MDLHRSCPRCGWPDDEMYEFVSRHQTTEGPVVYSRCVCGRLQVRRGDRVALRHTGPPRPAPAPATRPGHTGPRTAVPGAVTAVVRVVTTTAAAAAGAALVLVGAVTLPGPALLPWAALAGTVGAIAGVGTWLVLDDPGRAARAALRAAGAAGAAGLALGGLLAVFGAAAVALVPLSTALAGLAWWLLRGSADGPGTAHVRADPARGREGEPGRCLP